MSWARRGPCPTLTVTAAIEGNRAVIRLEDNGSKPECPELLFRARQPGIEDSGLFISQAVVRAFGGDVRYEPEPHGSCFVVELQMDLDVLHTSVTSLPQRTSYCANR